MGDNMTHSVIAVDNRCGLCLFDDIDHCDRVQYPLFHPVIINRLESPYPVGIDSQSVSRDQDLTADFGIARRDAQSLKSTLHKGFQLLRRNIS